MLLVRSGSARFYQAWHRPLPGARPRRLSDVALV